MNKTAQYATLTGIDLAQRRQTYHTIRFRFTDFKPNGNNYAVPLSELQNILDTGPNMPIKASMWRGSPQKHEGARNVGVITSLWYNQEEEAIDGEGRLWVDGSEDLVEHIQSSLEENKPPRFSWEIDAVPLPPDKSGVSWLKDCVVFGHTFVSKPAYGDRTPMLAFAELQTAEQHGTVPNYRYADVKAGVPSCAGCVFWENVDRYGGDGSTSHQSYCTQFNVGIDVLGAAVCDAFLAPEDAPQEITSEITLQGSPASAHAEDIEKEIDTQENQMTEAEIKAAIEAAIVAERQRVEAELGEKSTQLEAELATYKRAETVAGLRQRVLSEVSFAPETGEAADSFLLELSEAGFEQFIAELKALSAAVTQTVTQTVTASLTEKLAPEKITSSTKDVIPEIPSARPVSEAARLQSLRRSAK